MSTHPKISRQCIRMHRATYKLQQSKINISPSRHDLLKEQLSLDQQTPSYKSSTRFSPRSPGHWHTPQPSSQVALKPLMSITYKDSPISVHIMYKICNLSNTILHTLKRNYNRGPFYISHPHNITFFHLMSSIRPFLPSLSISNNNNHINFLVI